MVPSAHGRVRCVWGVAAWGGVVVARRVGVSVRAGASERWLAEGGSGLGTPAAQVAEIQRSRLLAGALGALNEHGYARTTVAQITSRSRVSRRTFYELFENREACLAALLEDILGTLREELEAAGLEDLAWRERVRGGLWVILCFFDRQPTLARVLMEQSAHGGARVLERREQIHARLAAILDEGRGERSRGGECSSLTGGGLIGAVGGIVNARLSRREPEPMRGLLGELMGLIVLPYLGT